MKFLVALRLQGEQRKFCRLTADKRGNFYAFGLAQPLELDRHATYHESGERHFITQGESVRGERLKCYVVGLQPTPILCGVEQLLKSGVDRGQFQLLPLLKPSSGKVILLDADTASFRDEWFGVNIYLVEEGREDKIPFPPHVGPRVLHIERSTRPWIAVEAFQERIRDK